MDGLISRVRENWPTVLLTHCRTASDLLFDPVAVREANRVAPAMGVPAHFLVQLLQVEDTRFSVHFGIDPIAVLRAATANGTGIGVVQGASTITQQLYNIKQEARGIERRAGTAYKMQQAIWALAEEAHRSKREILREYIDTIYWGRSYHGIDAAASGYLRTSREKLTAAQGFFLVERIASPNRFITGRVSDLLQRSPIATLLAQDRNAREELAAIYDEHFGSGHELRRLLG